MITFFLKSSTAAIIKEQKPLKCTSFSKHDCRYFSDFFLFLFLNEIPPAYMPGRQAGCSLIQRKHWREHETCLAYVLYALMTVCTANIHMPWSWTGRGSIECFSFINMFSALSAVTNGMSRDKMQLMGSSSSRLRFNFFVPCSLRIFPFYSVFVISISFFSY